MMSLYNCIETKNGYRMVKFDDTFYPEHVYDLKKVGRHFTCNCFAGEKSTCRHREMLVKFLENKSVNTGEFFNHETGEWHPPLIKWED